MAALSDNALYAVGARLGVPGLVEQDFIAAWRASKGGDKALFAAVSRDHLSEMRLALEDGRLKPTLPWLAILMRAARALNLAAEFTRAAAMLLATAREPAGAVSPAMAAKLDADALALYEEAAPDLSAEDAEAYGSVLWSAGRAYENVDQGDGAALEKAVEALGRVTGGIEGPAQVAISDDALRLHDIRHDRGWLQKAFDAASRGVAATDKAGNPDWHARALHQRGIARTGLRREPADVAASIEDLEAAYAVWSSHGSALDRCLNRLALANLHVFIAVPAGEPVPAAAMKSALACYRQAYSAVAKERGPGYLKLAAELRRFLSRALDVPLASRLSALDEIWESMPDALLQATEMGSQPLDEFLSRSMWIPQREVAGQPLLPANLTPSETDAVTRRLVLRWEDAWASAARSLCRNGIQRRVIDELAHFVGTQPDDAEAQYQLGVLYIFDGRSAEARAALERARQRKPNWDAPARALAMLQPK